MKKSKRASNSSTRRARSPVQPGEPASRLDGAPEKPFHVRITDERNEFWKVFNEHNFISIEKHDYLNAGSKVFTMGSCFAVEIRSALAAHGLDVYPKYKSLDLNAEKTRVGALPARDNINHYHTFAILQEFEKFHGEWTQSPTDIWEKDDHIWDSGGKIYQDPYRRSVFARSPDDLLATIASLDDVVADGIRAADVFLITLGLIEVWRKKDDGRFACEYPGYNLGGGHDETEFHLSTYPENYENLRRTVSYIKKTNPDAHIVFTVSPVWLGRTFSGGDIFVANAESKSQLRAICGQLARDEADVLYFPSYEIALALHGEGHAADGRHVNADTVANITGTYMFAHSNGALALK